MATGRNRYFRHVSNARNDEFILDLMNEFGLQGYFYYFALIELCSEKYANEGTETFIFHRRILTQELRLTTRKLNLLLTYLQDRLKISYTLVEHTYEINVHNLFKFLGKYQTEKSKKTRNLNINLNSNLNLNLKKRGSASGDATAAKPKKSDTMHTEILDAWNNKISDAGLAKAKALNKKRKSSISAAVKAYPEMKGLEAWEKYFAMIAKTPFLTGQNDRGWKADFDWVINQNNLIKVVEGRYDNIAKQKEISTQGNPTGNPYLERARQMQAEVEKNG